MATNIRVLNSNVGRRSFPVLLGGVSWSVLVEYLYLFRCVLKTTMKCSIQILNLKEVKRYYVS